jgi:ABC-type branched-subunit amino acid transport system ATPase component
VNHQVPAVASGFFSKLLEQLSKVLERLRQTTQITVLLGEQNVYFRTSAC